MSEKKKKTNFQYTHVSEWLSFFVNVRVRLKFCFCHEKVYENPLKIVTLLVFYILLFLPIFPPAMWRAPSSAYSSASYALLSLVLTFFHRVSFSLSFHWWLFIVRFLFCSYFSFPAHGLYLSCYAQTGSTSLFIASQEGHTATAKLLLEAGADKEVKSKVHWESKWNWECFIFFGWREKASHWPSYKDLVKVNSLRF